MKRPVLVTGATGNAGRELVRHLTQRGIPARAAVRPDEIGGGAFAEDLHRADDASAAVEIVPFDFEDASTFGAVLDGASRVFFMRPPHMARARAFAPFIHAMEEASIEHVVFLSLMGAGSNPLAPHRRIEILLDRSPLICTHLRPSFFMQNLTTTHLPEIVERDEVFVPAGDGATSFVDVRDVAEAAAMLLCRAPASEAFTLTGPAALTYEDVAAVLSAELGREIRYVRPRASAFAARMRERGVAPDMVRVMRAIYLVARIGAAGGITDELERLLERPPVDFAEFVADHRRVFESPA